ARHARRRRAAVHFAPRITRSFRKLPEPCRRLLRTDRPGTGRTQITVIERGRLRPAKLVYSRFPQRSGRGGKTGAAASTASKYLVRADFKSETDRRGARGRRSIGENGLSREGRRAVAWSDDSPAKALGGKLGPGADRCGSLRWPTRHSP